MINNNNPTQPNQSSSRQHKFHNDQVRPKNGFVNKNTKPKKNEVEIVAKMLPRKWAWPEFTMGQDAKLLLDTILYGGAAKLHAIAPSSHSLPPLRTPFFFFFFLLSLNCLFVFLSSLHNCTIDFELGFVSTSKNKNSQNHHVGITTLATQISSQHFQQPQISSQHLQPKSDDNIRNPNLKITTLFFGCKTKKSQHINNFCCLQKKNPQISKSQQHCCKPKSSSSL
jgi:hypothetical protein